jgi:hypothetical protein
VTSCCIVVTNTLGTALGAVARDGRGMPANAGKAYYHFRVATLQEGKPANQPLASDLQRFSVKIGAEQTLEVGRDASTWVQNDRLSLEFVYKGGQMPKGFPASAL